MATIIVTGPQGRPISTDPPVGYFANSLKYYRMDNSMKTEFLLLVGSYLHLDIGFLVVNEYIFSPNVYLSELTLCGLVSAMWSVGALIGCLIYGFGMTHLSNKRVNQIAAFILLASGVLLAVGCSSLIAINAGRLLAGCCSGIIYIATVKRIGDNAPRTYRGALATKLSMVAALGSLLASGILGLYNIIMGLSVESLDRNLGFVTSAFALAAAITSCFSSNESVVRLVMDGKNQEAFDLLVKLCNESHETSEIRNEFDEVKAMVDEANADAKIVPNHIFSGGNQKVLGMVTSMKILNNITPSHLLQLISISLLGEQIDHFIAMIAYPSLRSLALFVPLFTIDLNGRRNLMLTSVIGTSVSLMVLGAILGILYVTVQNLGRQALCLAGLVACTIKVFASFSLEPMQHVYAVEAFPLAKRTGSIMFATSCGHIVQIVFSFLSIAVPNYRLWYIITMILHSISVFFGGLWLYNRLPETRALTMRQCHRALNPSRTFTSGISTISATCGP